MSLMALESEILRKLAHSGLKTLGSLVDLLGLYDLDKDHGLHDPETRRIFRQSIQALSQTIRDLRLLAICEEVSGQPRNGLNWRSVIESSLEGRSSKTTLRIDEGNYEGDGYVELINSGLGSLAWFAKQFWTEPVDVRLSIIDKNRSAWISIKWNFGKTVNVDPRFNNFTPFFPMFPKESLALDKSTGLVLYTIKRISELHQGSLIADCSNGLSIELIWPKSEEKKLHLA